MKTKLFSLTLALLAGMSAWADDVLNVSVYDDCSKNGYRISGAPADVQAVDLGLPSGIKWASCNVGAETPEGYGNYYAWGEVTTKEDYSWSTYKYANGSSKTLTKYCNDSTYGNNGFKDNKIVLDLEDDAAYVNWGCNWRMPTDAEIDELRNNCTWTWVTQNSVDGYLVTCKTNSNSIFLPAAGCYRYDTNNPFDVGADGYYWSASLHENEDAGELGFGHVNQGSSFDSRYYGFTIRPVYLDSVNRVTFSLSGNGCEKANAIKVNKGQQVTITAVPLNEHHHFVQWSDGNTDNPRTIVITSDTTFTAEFAANQYTIHTSAYYDDRGRVESVTTADYMSEVTLTAIANDGYKFLLWADDENTDNPRTVTITKDVSFTAVFTSTRHSVDSWVSDTLEMDNHPEMGYVIGDTTIDQGECATLTAIPNNGYHFVRWGSRSMGWEEYWGPAVGLTTFIVPAHAYSTDPSLTDCYYDIWAVATFAKNTYTITAQSADETKGYVSAPSHAEYLDQVTLTATANSDCHFTQWSDGVTDNPRTIVLTCDTTLTAEFAYDPYLTLVTGEKGTVSGAGYFKTNTSRKISATANYGYHFTQWSDGNTDNPRTIVITSDTTFTAEFAANQYTISTAVNDAECGSVEGATTANYLDSVTLTAISNYGYYFAYWSICNNCIDYYDYYYDDANPLTVEVTGDETYTAVFGANTYTITAQSADETKGYVSAPSQSWYLNQVTLTATANHGYHFTQWSDGDIDNPRTIVLTRDTAFTAEFAQTFSGQCGDNLYWSYVGHTLTISGTGEMYNYDANTVPWLLFRDTTTEVILERGITSIGTYAFNGCVKLRKIELPNTLTSIGANAFAGCRKLYYVYSYAVEPPIADNTSFANYNVYLYVPCDNLFEYQLDALFGSFKYIQCLGAENTTTEGNVTVTPSDDEAVFVWPADGSANTYTLQISKDGTVFCTLIFNANGQLNSIAFAPARNGQKHQAAEQTGSGFRFTVTGLSESTHYTFDMTVKDSNDATLQTYTGEFNTTGQGGTATSVDNTTMDTTPSKIFRNGQVYILRGEKTYTITGDEVK